MRLDRLVAFATAAPALVVATPAAASILPPPGPHTASPVGAPTCCPPVHLSATHLAVAQLNSTTASRPPAELTGGAIPHQMKASVVGLLGFCIMGLVML